MSTCTLLCAKLALDPLVAFAAGGGQVVLVDAGAGVGGRENQMESVATAAIGGAGGAVLRGQPVVTGEKRLHPVRRQIVFGVQALGGVALAANLLRNFQRRASPQRFDFVFRMAIRAGGGSRRPAATALPWTLAITSLASCSWHCPQVLARLAKFSGRRPANWAAARRASRGSRRKPGRDGSRCWSHPDAPRHARWPCN